MHIEMPVWLSRRRQRNTVSAPAMLGILAFEAARAMTRLVSLYRSLTDAEICRLRLDLTASVGVARLTSDDESRLLLLACSELIGELDAAADVAARLSRRCLNPCLVRFDLVYADVKLGVLHPGMLRLEFGSAGVNRIVETMDRLSRSTASLFSTLESLSQLELSQKRIEKWRRSAGGGDSDAVKSGGFGLVGEKIAFLKTRIETLRQASLWNTSHDESVGLMARVVCVVFVRLTTVFSPLVSEAAKRTQSPPRRDGSGGCSDPYACQLEDRRFHQRNRKWSAKTATTTGHHSSVAVVQRIGRWEVVQMAGPETVGASGMAARYACVIAAAEGCLCAPETVSEDTRAALYELLPERLRRRVAEVLRRRENDKQKEGFVEETMEWLAPLAHNTATWQSEKNLERQRGGFQRNPASVLLAQTLFFSNLDKTESAIVDVLVGLTHILRRTGCTRRRRIN